MKAQLWAIGRYLPLVLLVLFVAVVFNINRIETSLPGAILHTGSQFMLFYSIMYALQDRALLQNFFVLSFSVELFTRLAYDAWFSVGMVMSVLMTSSEEISEFLQFHVQPLMITTALLVGLCKLPVVPRQKEFDWAGKLGLGLGVAYVLLPSLFYGFNSLHSANKDLVMKSLANESSLLSVAWQFTFQAIAVKFAPINTVVIGVNSAVVLSRPQQLDSGWVGVEVDQGSPDLLVLGIGESLRANNMGIYGYDRNTTPRLAESGVHIYQHAYAAGTNTWAALPNALTLAEDSPDLSLSIINLAADAGYMTHWLSNQTQFGSWDLLVRSLSRQADKARFTSADGTGTQLDSVLVELLEDTLSTLDPARKHFVVLHFYGSHMNFADRYPLDFDVFQGGQDTLLDEYDNSVLYTDHIQSETIELVTAHGGEYLFFADHGLVRPGTDIGLRHDMRDVPSLDSLKVPFLSSTLLPRMRESTSLSLYYFEGLFSLWSGISAAQLVADSYCDKALASSDIRFVDSNLVIWKRPQVED